MHIRRGISFVGLVLGCAMILLANARCGEYLLLHYLVGPDGVLLSDPAVGQVKDPGEVQMEPLPPVETAEEPLACIREEGPAVVAAIPLQPMPPGTCLQGDLNKDGKVDGLDIQVLVNCMLAQQSN